MTDPNAWDPPMLAGAVLSQAELEKYGHHTPAVPKEDDTGNWSEESWIAPGTRDQVKCDADCGNTARADELRDVRPVAALNFSFMCEGCLGELIRFGWFQWSDLAVAHGAPAAAIARAQGKERARPQRPHGSLPRRAARSVGP